MSMLANLFRRPIASSSRLITVSPDRTFYSTPVSLDKLKSHSGTKKRFFKTGSGLVSYLHPMASREG